MAGRCTASTKAGAPCAREATHGAHCYQHAPATADRAAASSRKGGERRQQRTRAEEPVDGAVKLELGTRRIETHQDLVRLNLDLAQAVLRGEVDSQDASRVGFLLQPIIRSGALPIAEPEEDGEGLGEDEAIGMTEEQALERINDTLAGKRRARG